MYINRGMIAKILSNKYKVVFSKFVPIALAESAEGSDDPDKGNEGSPVPINYEELIARARKEEKDKLYGTINSLKSELNTAKETINKHLLTIGTLQSEIDNLKSKKSNSNNQEVTELKNKISDLEEQLSKAPKEEDLRTQIRTELESEYSIKLYAQKVKSSDEVKRDVLPMFLDDITGTTEEEINEAVKKAKEKTAMAREQLGIDANSGKSKDDSKESKEKSAKSGRKNPPMSNPQNSNSAFSDKVDWDYVKNLDTSSPEYAEWRKKVGLR